MRLLFPALLGGLSPPAPAGLLRPVALRYFASALAPAVIALFATVSPVPAAAAAVCCACHGVWWASPWRSLRARACSCPWRRPLLSALVLLLLCLPLLTVLCLCRLLQSSVLLSSELLPLRTVLLLWHLCLYLYSAL